MVEYSRFGGVKFSKVVMFQVVMVEYSCVCGFKLSKESQN